MSTGTTPFWLDAPYEPRGPLEGDVEVEACVIGGGVGGLSCARRLAQLGIETVLLEAGTVAGGASGRNGGFLIAGTAAFHNDAREQYGAERARAMYARTLDAQRDIYGLAAELGAGDALRQVGLLRLAVSEEEAEHVRDHARALQEDGFPGEVVEREELPPALQRSGLVGCLTDHDGALQPARWYRLLAGAAEQAGARICEGTRGARARAGARRGPGGHGARQRARAPRGRGRRRRAAGPRSGVRRTRALAQAPHGRHRAAAPDARPPGLRALGLRVPPAAPRRAHPRGRLQRRGRRQLLHRQRRRQPG